VDVAQVLEDVLEELASIQKGINKLTTASVSGQALRNQVKETHKSWLPAAGVLEKSNTVDATQIQEISDAWTALAKLANGKSPKKQYKALLRTIVTKTESELLHKFIKGSAIQTIGDTLRKFVQPINNAELLKYLDESIRCAETNCVRASVVLAWCAVAHTVHQKLRSLGIATLNAEFAKMKADNGLMFRCFTRVYAF
jgi:hypothetical protein